MPEGNASSSAVDELRQSIQMTDALKQLSDRVYTLNDDFAARFSFVEEACESRYHDNETIASQVSELKDSLEILAENVNSDLEECRTENKSLKEQLNAALENNKSQEDSLESLSKNLTTLQKERAGDRVLMGALMERLDRLEKKFGEQNSLLSCVTREVEVLIDAVPQVEEEMQDAVSGARGAAKHDNDRVKARLDLQELAVARIEETQDHLVAQVSAMQEQVSNNAVQSRLEDIAHHLNRASQQSTLEEKNLEHFSFPKMSANEGANPLQAAVSAVAKFHNSAHAVPSSTEPSLTK